ncbi:hypothetical protein [Qipengyuania flava]|uniref:hypothetical protein n=1 Tax=Qipengyuania flava TaxID=192812 RepID=UPI001C582D9E|nr:hypothetical protein [Qipengyuania flava]MBW3167964.1 hypothetical protein [Qipengyuania flava]MBY5965202.1 hypothetical protein [Qipengyuania flava]MBY6011526.1 hypothetical protein [Qipengyuania flava]MBY6025968.1 hypothetical protein [Qipengyuania flava]
MRGRISGGTRGSRTAQLASGIPDPAAHQRAQVARGKADQRLQEEQQKSLLGGAAKQGRDADQGQDHGHDYGDFDPDM